MLSGVLFLPEASREAIARAARGIRETELRQASQVQAGTSLRSQLRFSEFLKCRRDNPAFTFRDHLASIGGAIEVEVPLTAGIEAYRLVFQHKDSR